LPMEVASGKFEEALFGNNALGRDVIGYRDSIKRTTRADLEKYLEQHYRSRNTVIVVAGNISSLSEQELLRLIENSFTFPGGSGQDSPSIELPTHKRLEIVNKKTEQTHLVIGFRGVSYKSEDRYAIRLLAMILGGSMSSRMFTEIREKLGLAYAVRTSAGNYLDTGAIETYAGVPHNKAEEAITAILNEYRKATVNISKEEFTRAKEIISGKMLIAFEDTNELSNHYALSELLSNSIITPKELVKKYEETTLDQVLAAGRKYFKEDSMALSLVDSAITKENIAKYFNFKGE
jgi:predicted Zn-dependent peptidase